MLIRSRMAMKDADKARAALEKAKTVFADEPETQKRIVEAAEAMGVTTGAKVAETTPSAGAAPATDAAAANPGAAATPGPSAADIENAKQLKPEDRQAMVGGMVDRLASKLETSPKDPDGWIMLIRSRMMMKDAEKARAALEKAKTVFADEPETQRRIVQAAQAMGIAANQ